MEFLKSEHKCKNFDLLIKVLVVFLIVFAFSGLVGAVNKIRESKYIGQDAIMKNTISVAGEGEVYAKPDLGIVTFSVKTEDRGVSGAMKENTAQMNAVIEAVKSAGINEEDLKTINFSIQPHYEYPEPTRRRILVGYEVSQSLQVKIRELEKAGQIIQNATNAGANQVDDLAFAIDNEEELKSQAREEAIKEARAKAKEIAEQLGVSLVRIINFNENTYSLDAYKYMRAESGGGGIGGAGTPQIETGENKIESNVNIVYEIN